MNKHNERAELKPCPFCGEAHDLTVHVYGNGEDDAYVQCRECTTCGPDGGDREGAIVKWNQRAAMLEAQPAEQRTHEETAHYLSGKIDGKIEMLNIETAFPEQAKGLEAVAWRAWFDADNGARWLFSLWPEEERLDVEWQPLYTTPPAQPAREWQPIETAPKDGALIVVRGNNHGDEELGQHHCIACWHGGAWMEASDWNPTSELTHLTHWAPLPEDITLREKNAGQPAADDKKAHLLMGEQSYSAWQRAERRCIELQSRIDELESAADDKAGGEPVTGRDLFVAWWDGYGMQPGVECSLPVWKYQETAIQSAWNHVAMRYYTHPQPQSEVRVPDGYALVPVEPTREMIKAGEIPTRSIDLGNGTRTLGFGLGASPDSIYRRMLAAAPKPKSEDLL